MIFSLSLINLRDKQPKWEATGVYLISQSCSPGAQFQAETQAVPWLQGEDKGFCETCKGNVCMNKGKISTGANKLSHSLAIRADY